MPAHCAGMRFALRTNSSADTTRGNGILRAEIHPGDEDYGFIRVGVMPLVCLIGVFTCLPSHLRRLLFPKLRLQLFESFLTVSSQVPTRHPSSVYLIRYQTCKRERGVGRRIQGMWAYWCTNCTILRRLVLVSTFPH